MQIIHSDDDDLAKRQARIIRFFWPHASRASSCIALAPLIRLFCRLMTIKQETFRLIILTVFYLKVYFYF